MASQSVYEDRTEEGIFVEGIGESQSACFVWKREEENVFGRYTKTTNMAQRRLIFSMRYHRLKAISGI